MRTKSQNAKRSRTKGAAFEREVARLLSTVWPDSRRNLSQSRKGEGGDVLGTPYHFELKCGASIDLDGALAQAERDALGCVFAGGRLAPPIGALKCIVIAKKDRHQPIVYGRACVVVAGATSHIRISALLEDWIAEQRAST
jgi:hypothetical protein